jgi:hypothetical protein
MRTLLSSLLLLAACAAPPPAERTAVVPLGPPVPAADLARDAGVPASADRSPPVAPVDVAPAPVGESVSWRTVTEVREVPAPEPVAQQANQPAASWTSGAPYAAVSYDPYGYGYADPYRYERRRARETWFPYGTVVGIGLGSAFDHHHHHGWRRSHHHHHGAWIGGTLGLLYDLGRWTR